MAKRKHHQTAQEQQEAERAKRIFEERRRQRKEKRDVAMALLLAIAGFVLTLFLKVELAGIAALGGLLCVASLVANTERFARVSRRKIRTTQAVIAVGGGLVIGAILYPYWIVERASASEGDLIGANDGVLPNGAIPWVQIGDSKTLLIMAPNGPKTEPYFRPFDDAEFLVEAGKTAPLISTTVRDRFGNLVVEIKRNHWEVHPPYSLDKNHTNRAFEVRDSSGHILLQLEFVDPRRAQVQGEWWNNENKGVRIVRSKKGDNGCVLPLLPQEQHNGLLIQEMFKYPSKKWLGEYSKRPNPTLPKPCSDCVVDCSG